MTEIERGPEQFEGARVAGLGEKTVSGILWTSLTEAGEQSLRFAIAVILARLLVPEDFGLLAMVMVFARLARLLPTMGFGMALIQKQDVEPRHLSSVFWLSLITGLLLTLTVAFCSPLIAKFYGQPALVPITIAVSLTFIIESSGAVQGSLLLKGMDFRRLAMIRITALTIAGAASVAMALSGFGIWSLVANSLLIAGFTAALLWYLSDWRPELRFDLQAIGNLIGFSANLLGARICNYWVLNVDNLLVGKYVSSFALGIYGRAYTLMSLPVTQISLVLARVMFPALSAMQSDKARIKQVFLKANRAIAFVGFPIMMGLLVVAEPFVLTVYGPKWESVIVILQFFCIDGIRRFTLASVSWIYLSQGRTDLMLKLGAFSAIVTTVSVVIGLRWGPAGVAAALVLAGYIILWYPSVTVPGRLIHVTFTEVLKNVAPIFWCSGAMVAALLGLGSVLPTDWPQWARLAVQAPFGLVVYVLIAVICRIRAYEEIKEIALNRLGRIARK